MLDLIQSPTFVTLLLLFYWVPFAVGAWFADHGGAERTRAWSRKLLHPTRHIEPGGHAPAAA